MVLAISTTSIPGDLEAKLSIAAEAGFTGVELHEPDFTGYDRSAADVGQMAKDLGLEISVLQPFRNLEAQIGPARTQAFARLERKFDLMQDLGVSTLLVGSAVAPDTVASDTAAVEDLAEAAARAGDRGLRLAYLGLPWAAHVQDEAAALKLIEQVDSPHLGLALNSYFSLAGGAQPARLRNVPGSRLFHVQLSDAPRMDSDIRSLKRHFGLLPGQGALNIAGFIRVLARNGYSGPWSIARVNEAGPRPGGRLLARDAWRALVNVLDEVARTDPEMGFGTPALPERVYPSGFEFVEFAVDGDSGSELTSLLKTLSFRMERRHKSKSVELWRQGAVNIVVNTDKDGFARRAFEGHGPCVCDMGLRVKDAARTVARASALGAPVFSQPVGTGELDIPAIRGVGGNVVHFIDEKSDLHRVWDIEFQPATKTPASPPAGLRRVDHVAQTMRQEEMQSWLLFYLSTFEMAKSAVVGVSDPSGVVQSQAIESPEGEVRLNLNGAEGQRTLAASFLEGGFGAGVQHIALASDDIFETSARLADAGFCRLPISPNYYASLQVEYDLSSDFTAQLKNGQILYDRDGRGEYFQIYSVPVFNGFFFEIVERRGGYAGYGARNASIRLAAQQKHQTAVAGA